MIETLQHFVRAGLFFWLVAFGLGTTQAAVPQRLNHQGRVAVNGVNFDGTGQFKFALVNANGSTTYWSNDGSSNAGSQPTSHVTLAVTKGLYSVLLGDTSLTNMTALPSSALDHEDVRLRIWFNDGSLGFQLITPDQRLASAPYALLAASASSIALSAVNAAPVKPVVAWGYNGNGQTTLPSLSGVAAVAGGESHSIALLDAGTVVAWGLNDETNNQTTVPGTATGVTDIAAGVDHNLARKSNGTIVAWGSNASGKATVPSGITTATKVAAGANHSLALLANGTVRAWGDNTWGQTTIPSSLTGVTVTAIASGYDHNLALTAAGAVVAWGRGSEEGGAGQITVPTAATTGVIAIAAGAYHSLALKSNGTVVAWGWNEAGQCNVPTDLSGVTQIAAGYGFSLALKSNGAPVVWGETADGVPTIPATASEVTAIAAGARHALALRSDLIPAQVARLDQDNVFTGKVTIQGTPGTYALEVNGNAWKSTGSSWLTNSDRRIKTDIASINGALEKIDQVRLVDFRYTENYLAAHPEIEDRRYPNVIAQEFQEVFPDDVKASGQRLPDGSEILQVDTYPLTIYSAAAIQELHRENRLLKKKLSDQEQRLRKLEEILKKK
jgi:alpha-tubulin suppressor-like RCC1 family protein